MRTRLLGGDTAVLQKLLHQRMIPGDLPDLVPVAGDQIGAAVADVDDIPVSVVFDNTADQRRTHALEGLVKAGILKGYAVCVAAGLVQQFPVVDAFFDPGGQSAVEMGNKSFVGQLTGNLAGACAAHPVA